MVCTMRTRLAQVAGVGVLAFAGLGLSVAPASASWASRTTEVSTLRAHATRFVTAELKGDGTTACAVLNAPLSDPVGHRTCAQRWDASLRTLLANPSERRQLRADATAIATAHVGLTNDGYTATIALPTPLLGSGSRFVWTDNCWMLER